MTFPDLRPLTLAAVRLTCVNSPGNTRGLIVNPEEPSARPRGLLRKIEAAQAVPGVIFVVPRCLRIPLPNIRARAAQFLDAQCGAFSRPSHGWNIGFSPPVLPPEQCLPPLFSVQLVMETRTGGIPSTFPELATTGWTVRRNPLQCKAHFPIFHRLALTIVLLCRYCSRFLPSHSFPFLGRVGM